eukprot:GILJ01002981.1.p1 GENE.GILJ01002981.1~~GILJ01002981.1.p1  ORF type:complete len:385 (-),score=38.78 GILJ01002981.1:148-1302(-)
MGNLVSLGARSWLPRGVTEEDLRQNPKLDRILGCLYGQALGDAVGLSTEFLTKELVEVVHGTNPIPFPDFARTNHSNKWKPGDWTDDTDQMILVLQAILESPTAAIDYRNFAQKLPHWANHGFPELGDTVGSGIGFTVGSVIFDKDFLADPHATAEKIWTAHRCNLAANGAVMRTSIIGCWQFMDLDTVIENAVAVCKVTHADSRCIASCVLISTLIALFIQRSNIPAEGSPVDEPACDSAHEQQLRHLEEAYCFAESRLEPQYLDEFRKLKSASLEDLQLGASKSIGYTFKATGAALWALQANVTFEDAIMQITREAGDADTNCAVAGAALGAYLGYTKLPRNWLSALKHKSWLDKFVSRFIERQKDKIFDGEKATSSSHSST